MHWVLENSVRVILSGCKLPVVQWTMYIILHTWSMISFRTSAASRCLEIMSKPEIPSSYTHEAKEA